MSEFERNTITGIGNIYVETNYLGLKTGGSDTLEAGKEYRAGRHEKRLGGSVVNFVTQAKKLGAEVGLIGKRGEDDEGQKLIQLLEKEGIATDLIVSSPDVQTSVDTGVVLHHSGNNIQLVAGDANQRLSRADIDLSHPHFDTVQAVYLGGFLKQESLYQDYPTLLADLQSKGIRIFFDHGRIPVDITDEQRSLLKQSMQFVEGYLPNEDELKGITGKERVDEALDDALAMGPKIVVVKLGKDGCRIKTANEDISIPGHDVEVVSTVGAGDAFNAAFVTEYLKGNDLKTCGEFANTTAAIRVSKNHQPDTNEVLDSLHSVEVNRS